MGDGIGRGQRGHLGHALLPGLAAGGTGVRGLREPACGTLVKGMLFPPLSEKLIMNHSSTHGSLILPQLGEGWDRCFLIPL